MLFYFSSNISHRENNISMFFKKKIIKKKIYIYIYILYIYIFENHQINTYI